MPTGVASELLGHAHAEVTSLVSTRSFNITYNMAKLSARGPARLLRGRLPSLLALFQGLPYRAQLATPDCSPAGVRRDA